MERRYSSIYLPVKPHEYFERKKGNLTNMVQISEDSKLRIVKKVEKRDIALSGEIALDFGMECLLVSDRGDLFGREFYDGVREYFQKLDRIQKEMQRQGRKPTESKRYVRLQSRLSGYVKSEVRRIVNRVIELYRTKRLVLEDLKGFLQRVINNFPKSVKRVLVRFGLGELKRKLKEISEEYGIEVVFVSPAYSSQACSSCGYVEKENRNSSSSHRKIFHRMRFSRQGDYKLPCEPRTYAVHLVLISTFRTSPACVRNYVKLDTSGLT